MAPVPLMRRTTAYLPTAPATGAGRASKVLPPSQCARPTSKCACSYKGMGKMQGGRAHAALQHLCARFVPPYVFWRPSPHGLGPERCLRARRAWGLSRAVEGKSVSRLRCLYSAVRNGGGGQLCLPLAVPVPGEKAGRWRALLPPAPFVSEVAWQRWRAACLPTSMFDLASWSLADGFRQPCLLRRVCSLGWVAEGLPTSRFALACRWPASGRVEGSMSPHFSV